MIRRSFPSLPTLPELFRVLMMCNIAAAFSFVPAIASAQAVPTCSRPQAIGVVEFMASQPDSRDQWLYGVDVSGELNSARFWGIRAELSSQHWNSPATRYFGGIGPQFIYRRGPIRLHVGALGGVSRSRVWIHTDTPSVVSAASSTNDSMKVSDANYSFAIRTGGGVDAHISERWMIRLAEVSFTGAVTGPDAQTVEYSSGVAYIF